MLFLWQIKLQVPTRPGDHYVATAPFCFLVDLFDNKSDLLYAMLQVSQSS